MTMEIGNDIDIRGELVLSLAKESESMLNSLEERINKILDNKKLSISFDLDKNLSDNITALSNAIEALSSNDLKNISRDLNSIFANISNNKDAVKAIENTKDSLKKLDDTINKTNKTTKSKDNLDGIKQSNTKILNSIDQCNKAITDFNKNLNTATKNNDFKDINQNLTELVSKINDARSAVEKFNKEEANQTDIRKVDRFKTRTQDFDDYLYTNIENSIEGRLNKIESKKLSGIGIDSLKDLKNQFNVIKDNRGNLEKYLELVTEINKQIVQFNNNKSKNTAGNFDFLDERWRKFTELANANPKYKATSGDEFKRLSLEFEALSNSVNPSQEAIDKFTRSLSLARIEANKTGRVGTTFFDTWKERMGSLTAYLVSFASVYRIFGYIKQAFQTIHSLDTALVDLQKTADMTSGEFNEFYYNASNVAKQFGVTTKDIIEQASALSRLGYNTKEAATTMAQVSSQFAAISPEMSVDQATTGLVSIMKAFDIEAEDAKEQIASKVNAIGNAFATSNDQIVTGLEKSSAAMAAARNSFDETVALFTAGQEVLQNADTVGQSLKTISMRIRGRRYCLHMM